MTAPRPGYTAEGRKLRYNKACRFTYCDRWAREDAIFCSADYKALPKHVQNKLWSQDPDILKQGIEEAEKYLEDKRNNALVTREEGP